MVSDDEKFSISLFIVREVSSLQMITRGSTMYNDIQIKRKVNL